MKTPISDYIDFCYLTGKSILYEIEDIPNRLNPNIGLCKIGGVFPFCRDGGIFPIIKDRQNIGIYRPDPSVTCHLEYCYEESEAASDGSKDNYDNWCIKVDDSTLHEGEKLYEYCTDSIEQPNVTKYDIFQFVGHLDWGNKNITGLEKIFYNRMVNEIAKRYPLNTCVFPEDHPRAGQKFQYLFCRHVEVEPGIDYYCKARWFDSFVNTVYTDRVINYCLFDIRDVIEFFHKHMVKFPFCKASYQLEIEECLAHIIGKWKHGDIFWLY